MRLAAGAMLIIGLVLGAAVCGHLMGRIFDRQVTALQVVQCTKASPWRR
jgi:hypothetical protein